MRILILSNLYAPEARGGAESIAKLTAQEMVRQGHTVTVLSTTAVRDAGITESSAEGVAVSRFCPSLPYALLEDAHQPLWRRAVWHARDLWPFGLSGHVVKETIERVKPDVIISHNLRGMGMSLVRGIQSSEVKWIHVLHDMQLLVPSGLFWLDRTPVWQRRFIGVPYQRWIRWLMGSPDLIVGPTHFIVDVHKKAGLFATSELRLLQNPVGDLEHRVRTVKQTRASGEPMRLLFVGQLEEHKGVSTVLEALMLPLDQSIQFDVVGAGSQLVNLEMQSLNTPENVTVSFHGNVSHAHVLSFMSQADALVFPSVAVENCPGVILEASAVGLLVIGSDQGGVPELIDASGLFEPGNVRAIAQAIYDVSNGHVRPLQDFQPVSVVEYVKRLLA
ncbi:TPA: hypothetical protein DEB00_00825 [Candidatus Uhrbacteria bacterium]|nr:hypothetical protein [Candidatus Uhrbacteria bacterium]